MTAFIIVLSIILLLFVAFILAVNGKKDPRLKEFKCFKYAHRGLHNDTQIPENCMTAFSKALDKGYGIEFDVHILADGSLAVFHDASLKRMVGEDVLIDTLTQNQLRNYRLKGTTESIPTFSEVLELVDGRVPLLIELKPPKEVARLCQTVLEQLKDYNGKYVIQSFDPRCIRWFKENSPETIRGQIAQNFLKDKKSKAPVVLKIILSSLLFNFLTKPNFVSYKFEDRNCLAVKIVQKLWGIDSFTWTIRSPENAKIAESENQTVIFEKFEA